MSEAYINKWAGGVRVEKLYNDTFNVNFGDGNSRVALMPTLITLPTDADILVIRGTIKVSATGGTLTMFTDNLSSTRDFFSLNNSSLLRGLPFSRMWIGGRSGDYWVAPTQEFTNLDNVYIPLRKSSPQELAVRARYNVINASAEGRIEVLAVWFG